LPATDKSLGTEDIQIIAKQPSIPDTAASVSSALPPELTGLSLLQLLKSK
jgi:hypothetical protein